MSRKAFTLIELLVVIAIIALLVSILSPSLTIAKDIAKQVTCVTNMGATAKGLLMYADENEDKYPPYGSTMTNGKPRVNLWYKYVEYTMWQAKEGDIDPFTLKQKYRGMGMAFASGTIESAHHFYCPAQDHPWFKYEEYVVDRTTGLSVRWGTLDNWSAMVRTGYWHNTWGKYYDQEKRWDIAFRSFSSMETDKALVIEQPVFPWATASHTARGKATPTINIAFPDGHAEGHTSSILQEVLLVNWGSPNSGILKNWANNPGEHNDWAEAYFLIKNEI